MSCLSSLITFFHKEKTAGTAKSLLAGCEKSRFPPGGRHQHLFIYFPSYREPWHIMKWNTSWHETLWKWNVSWHVSPHEMNTKTLATSSCCGSPCARAGAMRRRWWAFTGSSMGLASHHTGSKISLSPTWEHSWGAEVETFENLFWKIFR